MVNGRSLDTALHLVRNDKCGEAIGQKTFPGSELNGSRDYSENEVEGGSQELPFSRR